VAQLNECGVTPDQLRQSDPWGVGALEVNMFSMHYRQCQRQEQAAQGSEDDHRLSLPLGASALVAGKAVPCSGQGAPCGAPDRRP